MKNKQTARQLFNRFCEVYMASRNFSPRTRVEYSGDIEDFLRFTKTFDRPIKSFSLKLMYEWLAEMDRRKYAPMTRRRKVFALKTFYRFLEEFDYIEDNLAKKLIPPEPERNEPRVLTEQEYTRLRLSVANSPKEAAIIEILLQTGIRLSELINLTVRNIELPKKISQEVTSVGSLHVHKGKGGKSRTITLNWKACRALKSYLRTRPDNGQDSLFLTRYGKRYEPGGIQKMVKKYLRLTDIKGASVHSLRHTFATHMVKNGTKLDVVRQALGHQDLRTTSIYVDLARDVMDKELQQNAL